MFLFFFFFNLSSLLFLTTYNFHKTLYLAFSLFRMSFVATSIQVITNFSYSSFSLLGVSWRISNLFLYMIYLLLISLLVSEDQSYHGVLSVFFSYSRIDSGESLLR